MYQQHHQPCTTTYNSWQLKDCRAWSRCSLTYVKEQLLPRLLVQPNKIHSATSWWQSERASSFFPNSDLQFTGDCTRPPRLRTWSKLVVNFLGEIWRVWVHESACPLHEELLCMSWWAFIYSLTVILLAGLVWLVMQKGRPQSLST